MAESEAAAGARSGRDRGPLEPQAANGTEPAPEPETTEAGAEPETAEPEGAEPETAEPEAAEPDVLDETATEPEATLDTSSETSPAPDVSEPTTEVVPDALTEADLAPVAADGPRTVGRFVADALRAAGVRYAFTVPGESFLGLLDAFEGAGIRVVATRHEGAAAFMAEAHGQLTGRPAVCLGTRAVGGANLAIGIHTARQDSAPMFAVVGQVERAVRGREAFQEVDQVATLGGLAKWAAEPATAEAVGEAVSEAIRQALGGRPGPVLLSLAEDLLDEPVPDDAKLEGTRPPTARASDDEVAHDHRVPRLGPRGRSSWLGRACCVPGRRPS